MRTEERFSKQPQPGATLALKEEVGEMQRERSKSVGVYYRSDGLSYEKLWQMVQRIEKCSMADAMRQTQDRWPDLYRKFLAECPRGRL